MIIAVEEHWAGPENEAVRQKLSEKFNPPSYADPELISEQYMLRMGEDAFLSYRLREMDDAGIDKQILSYGSPGIQGVLDPKEAVLLAAKVNDMQKAVMERHKGRFEGFAALPTQDPMAAAKELRRAATELGFCGALINGHTFGKYIDERESWVIWETAEELGVPIYLHPYDPMYDQMKIYEGHIEMHGPTCSWNVETATHATRVVCSGLFDAFPDATLIIGHMGETLPYQLGRIDEGWRCAGGPKAGKTKFPPSYYIKKNIMISTSGFWRPETLHCAIAAMGEDRILFGGDYPFVLPKDAVGLMENSGVSKETRDKIYYKNAERLFNFPAKD